MNEWEVRSLLGDPAERRTHRGQTTWRYRAVYQRRACEITLLGIPIERRPSDRYEATLTFGRQGLETATVLEQAPGAAARRAALVCSLPGSVSCAAPGSKARIEWREPAGSGRHELWLRDSGKPAIRLLEFDRSADILWGPGAAAVAISVREGSSDSALLICRLDTPGRLLNVEEAFIRAFGKPREVYQHGHRYFSAKSWLSPTAVVFEVRAHDAAPGVEYRERFVYELAGDVHRQP